MSFGVPLRMPQHLLPSMPSGASPACPPGFLFATSPEASTALSAGLPGGTSPGVSPGISHASIPPGMPPGMHPGTPPCLPRGMLSGMTSGMPPEPSGLAGMPPGMPRGTQSGAPSGMPPGMPPGLFPSMVQPVSISRGVSVDSSALDDGIVQGMPPGIQPIERPLPLAAPPQAGAESLAADVADGEATTVSPSPRLSLARMILAQATASTMEERVMDPMDAGAMPPQALMELSEEQLAASQAAKPKTAPTGSHRPQASQSALSAVAGATTKAAPLPMLHSQPPLQQLLAPIDASVAGAAPARVPVGSGACMKAAMALPTPKGMPSATLQQPAARPPPRWMQQLGTPQHGPETSPPPPQSAPAGLAPSPCPPATLPAPGLPTPAALFQAAAAAAAAVGPPPAPLSSCTPPVRQPGLPPGVGRPSQPMFLPARAAAVGPPPEPAIGARPPQGAASAPPVSSNAALLQEVLEVMAPQRVPGEADCGGDNRQEAQSDDSSSGCSRRGRRSRKRSRDRRSRSRKRRRRRRSRSREAPPSTPRPEAPAAKKRLMAVKSAPVAKKAPGPPPAEALQHSWQQGGWPQEQPQAVPASAVAPKAPGWFPGPPPTAPPGLPAPPPPPSSAPRR